MRVRARVRVRARARARARARGRVINILITHTSRIVQGAEFGSI